MVKAKKSSCCNFRSLRMVSNIVEIVRRVVCSTGGLSDRASWNRYLQPWSNTSEEREG